MNLMYNLINKIIYMDNVKYKNWTPIKKNQAHYKKFVYLIKK